MSIPATKIDPVMKARVGALIMFSRLNFYTGQQAELPLF